MITGLRRESKRATRLGLAAAIAVLAVQGCAVQPEASGMTIEQLEALDIENGALVGEVAARVPTDSVRAIDVRIDAGVGNQRENWPSGVPLEIADWVVVGQCYFPGSSPPITLAVLPPDLVAAAQEPWNLECVDPGAGE